jgi:hypothetical protein
MDKYHVTYLNAEVAFYKANHHLQVVCRADRSNFAQGFHLKNITINYLILFDFKVF